MPDSSRTPERPIDSISYKRWLEDEHGLEVNARMKTRYEAIVTKVRADFVSSGLWERVAGALPDLDGEYRLIASNYPLFLTSEMPDVHLKSFDSFLLKTFRRNVLENANWPDPPPSGWLLPDEWYSQVKDLVRTSFVVKYLDGVRFLGDRLAEICAEFGRPSELSFEARMEGHYAAHLKVRDKFQIPGEQWDAQSMVMTIEIQITTQLQEAIRKLLHNYYESRRLLPEREQPNWQWEYESDEFVANYLGHILHYVEGMIMEVRNRQQVMEGESKWLV